MHTPLPMAPRPTHTPQKKSAPRGTIPPGPWYAIAWHLLSDDERHTLTHRTRNGQPLPPTLPDSPVQALSAPSKLPGYSWAMSAGLACPGAVYGHDPLNPAHVAICDGCYAGGAERGNPLNPHNQGRGYISRTAVRRALLVRWQFATILTATAAGRTTFAASLIEWITQNTHPANPYFRLHDSGDLFSPAYVDAWTTICQATPQIQYWAPTRSWHIAQSKGGRWAQSFVALNALPNTAIRPSALYVNQPAPHLAGWAAGTGVKALDWNCPASTTNNECQSCRQCWDSTTEVYYHLH